MTSISRFPLRHCLVFHRWLIHDEAKGGEASESEARFEKEFAYVFAPRWKKKKKSMRSRYRCVFNWKTVYSYSADWAESITAENTSRSNREMEIKVRNISVDHSPSSSLFLRILRIYPRINGRIPVSIPFFVDIGTIWFRFISNCFFFFLISCLVLIKFIIKFQYWFLSRWSMNE